MAHDNRCTSCRRRPQLADSVLCVACGRRSLQASLTRLQQHNGRQADTVGARQDQEHLRRHAAG